MRVLLYHPESACYFCTHLTINILDLLVHSLNSMPYVQIGIIIIASSINISFSISNFDFLPSSQFKSFIPFVFGFYILGDISK